MRVRADDDDDDDDDSKGKKGDSGSGAFQVTEDTTLKPGNYCNGIQISSGAVVDFEPGTYIVDGIGLHITGNSVVTGEEVTFYIPETAQGLVDVDRKNQTTSYNTLNIAGDADVTLSAPTGENDDYEGMLFYQDANAPADRDNKILGTSYTSLTGTLYFPNNLLRFAGTTEPGIGEWLDIIARELEFVGNTDITGNGDAEVPDELISATLIE